MQLQQDYLWGNMLKNVKILFFFLFEGYSPAKTDFRHSCCFLIDVTFFSITAS